jgi:deoxyribodipyrimidine photo-lyase
MSNPIPGIVWFRNNLRLRDNEALSAAAQNHASLLFIYIYPLNLGAATKWWLHHSLHALSQALSDQGQSLLLFSESTSSVLAALRRQTGAKCLYYNLDYAQREQEDDLYNDLLSKGWQVTLARDQVLFPPEAMNPPGKSYKVFTPFYRNVLATRSVPLPKPIPPLKRLIPARVSGERLEDWQLLPKVAWDQGFYPLWQPGEKGGIRLLKTFIKQSLIKYIPGRDFPAAETTSKLSPHLRFGEVSPRSLWHAVMQAAALSREKNMSAAAEAFLRQVVWRDFAYHIIYHHPQSRTQALRQEFAGLRWEENRIYSQCWQTGATGYPIVDAGMRQLWKTGWMHNRARMIVASFLTKDLWQDWRQGAAWFEDCLLDADMASNIFGWQWAAGCGADAAPYFRIFNPILQSKKFDPEGAFLRAWVPEIKLLPNKWIHTPWLAPKPVLAQAGVELGKNYPQPLVDHALARQKALSAYKIYLRRNF